VRACVAIVYNEPYYSRYSTLGEDKAVLGVLEAVAAVHQALLELDCSVTQVPLVPPIEAAVSKLRALDTDLVFNLFEGFSDDPETEAFVPELLSQMGIPYTGCPGPMLRLALDKAKLKTLLMAAGIPTPESQLLSPETVHLFRLDYPCIVKPVAEDASHGLSQDSVVSDRATLEKQVRFISSTYKGGALVEEFIDGREFNATVLGDAPGTVLPVSEIGYSLPPGMPKVLTFAAKWEPETVYFKGTRVICPAEISAEERQRIAATALATFRLLDGRGYARVDMRMDEEGKLYVIEVNPNPDISPDTGAATQAKAAGMTYTRFVEKIVELALEKKWQQASAP
jgi:D-alanine-D-alanine ligase